MTDASKQDVLIEVNEIGRNFWGWWSENHDEMMPPLGLVLHPSSENEHEIGYDFLEMPSSLEERQRVVSEFGHMIGQQGREVRFFFLIQEAWKAVVDEGQVPSSPVKEMPESQEVLACMGSSWDGTQLEAEQEIVRGSLREPTVHEPDEELEIPLVHPFWDGYSKVRN
jgi:hypothetical protein